MLGELQFCYLLDGGGAVDAVIVVLRIRVVYFEGFALNLYEGYSTDFLHEILRSLESGKMKRSSL